MEKKENNKSEKDLLKEFSNMSLEELIDLYGDIPMKLATKPLEHSILSAIDKTLEEDREVKLDETS